MIYSPSGLKGRIEFCETKELYIAHPSLQKLSDGNGLIYHRLDTVTLSDAP